MNSQRSGSWRFEPDKKWLNHYLSHNKYPYFSIYTASYTNNQSLHNYLCCVFMRLTLHNNEKRLRSYISVYIIKTLMPYKMCRWKPQRKLLWSKYLQNKQFRKRQRTMHYKYAFSVPRFQRWNQIASTLTLLEYFVFLQLKYFSFKQEGGVKKSLCELPFCFVTSVLEQDLFFTRLN